MQIKAKGLLKWIFGSMILETNHLGMICFGCGKYLGKIEMLGRSPTFDHLDTVVLCRDCYKKARDLGLQEVDWKTVKPPIY